MSNYWDDASKKHIAERKEADAQVAVLFQEWFGDVPITDAREVDGEKIVTFTFEATMVNGEPVVAEPVYPSETREFKLQAKYYERKDHDWDWSTWTSDPNRALAVCYKNDTQLYSTCLEKVRSRGRYEKEQEVKREEKVESCKQSSSWEDWIVKHAPGERIAIGIFVLLFIIAIIT